MKLSLKQIVLVQMVFAVLLHFPILTGQIPLPIGAANSFSAWASTPQAPNKPVIDQGLGDLVTLFYPWRNFAAEAIKGGVFPSWNPLVLGGSPFVADSQSAVYFPLNWLYIVMPVASAWATLFIVRTALAGIFMTLFTRALGVHPAAALCSGIAFATCGYITAWAGASLGDADIWLPLACYAVVRLSEQQVASSVVLAATAFSLPVLAGHPETAAHISLTALAVAAFQFFRITSERRLGFVLLFTASVVLSLGVASAQMLPTLEWLHYASTSLDYRWPPRPISWIVAVLSRDLSHNPNSAGIGIPEGAAYVGIVTLLLAATALVGKSRRIAWFFAFMGVVAAGIVYGVDPFHWISRVVPVVSGLKNMRLLLVLNFSLAVLLGIGMSDLMQAPLRRHRYVAPAAGVVIGWGLFALLLQELQIEDFRFRNSAGLTAILLIAGLATILLRAHSRLGHRAFAIAITAIVLIDSTMFSFGFVPLASREEIFASAPLFEFLKDHVSEWDRVGAVDAAIPPNATTMYGLRSLDGYDYDIQSMDGLFSDFREFDLTGIVLHSREIVKRSDRRLDMMGVKYLIASTGDNGAAALASRPDRFSLAFSSGSVRVFENLHVMPSVSLISSAKAEAILPSYLQLLRLRDPGFDPESAVVVSDLPIAFPAGAPDTGSNRVERLATDAPNQIRVKVQASEPSILVVNEAIYPGWTVTVDGMPRPVMKANYALLGVALGPGSHDVLFQYQSSTITAGIMISLLSIGLCGILLMFGRSQSRVLRLPLISAALVGAALTAGIVLIERPVRDVSAGTLELSRTEVTAGEDSYILRIKMLRNARVLVRYSLNGRSNQFRMWLDDNGEVRFDVGPETARGVYHFIAFREFNSDWASADAHLNVK